jgi:PAS domain S-box-containing protein
MPPLRSEDIAGLVFERVVRDAPVAIAVIDTSSRVIYSNARAQELTGRQLASEMPANLDGAIDIFHPDGTRYARDEWPAVRSISSGEEIADEEFFYALADGARLWIRCGSSPVRDEDGEIVAAVLALADVTDERRQQERLTCLEGLLENTEDAVVALDAEWFVTVWNPAAERLYGWTADEVLGRHTLDVARLDMSHEERAEFRLAVAEHGRAHADVVAYCKDGSPVRVALVTAAMRDADGEITGYLGIHREVSEDRRATRELRESGQRDETILESITDAFVALDQDWRYTYVNDRALGRLTAWRGVAVTRDDIIGRSVWELFPDAVGTEVEDRLRAVMGTQDPVEFELYFAPTDEWVEAHAYPSPSGLSIYFRNISARRRAEQALREAQEQRAAADRRLEEVRDAERARIARDLHDQALQGLMHALAVTGRRAPNADPEVHAILQHVDHDLRAAIYDLRLEQAAEHPLSGSLSELVELNREMAPGCDVALEVDGNVLSGSFGRRGTEVMRIIGEALRNACRHSGAERIVIRIAGTETRLSVEVTDDGCGFDLGPQAPPMRGQGLRGMHERAELLDARLEIRSDGSGTTVRLDVALTVP